MGNYPKNRKKRAPMPQEVRDRISATLTGRSRPDLLGKVPSEETRARMRASQANRPPTTPEIREQISKSLTGRVRNDIRDAKLASNGTGDYLDHRDNPAYKKWKFAVNTRDGFTCQRCSRTELKGRNCHAHHLYEWDDFPEFKFDVSKGITLCLNCHQVIHKQVKNQNFLEEDLRFIPKVK